MLFNHNDLENRSLEAKPSFRTNELHKYISEAITADLDEAIGQLRDGESIHFETINKWSLHDMLVYCLEQSGPAHVYFTTWSIKEYPARIFSSLKSDGKVKSIHALLDYRIETTSPEAHQILAECCEEIGYTRVHAKLTVIESEKFGITIVGSQNYTTNTRAEVGVITINKKLAEYRKNWILEQIANSNYGTNT